MIYNIMVKKIIFSFILAISVITYAACIENIPHKVIYIGYSLEKPFWEELGEKIQNYSQLHGIDIIDLTPPFLPFDQEQTQLMEFALENKVCALILGLGSPFNQKKLVAILDKFKTAKIPVVLIDSNFNHPAVAAFITSDNLFGARMAGKFIAEKLKNTTNPKVLILGGEKQHPNSQLRIQGFTEICEQENIKYQVVYADWLTEKAYNLSKQFLTVDSNFNAVFSCWDPGIIVSEAFYRTLKSSNHLFFLGFDGLPQTLSLIKTGRIEGTIAQDSNQMAEKTILITKQILSQASYQKETLIKPILINKQYLDSLKARK